MENKINTINYNPSGIDREKDFFVLKMNSGITRYVFQGQGHKGIPSIEQAPNGYTILNNVGYHMIFDLTKTDKFISLVRYYTQGKTSTLKAFTETIDKGEPIIQKCGICRWGQVPAALSELEQWFNIRLYPNNSIAIINTFINPKTKEKHSFQIDLTQLPSTNWDVWVSVYLKKLGLERTQAELEQYNRYYSRREREFENLDIDKVVTEIWSEDEIIPQHLSKKVAKEAYGFAISSGQEATLLYQPDNKNYAHEIDALPKEWSSFFPTLKDDRLRAATKMADENLCDHRLYKDSLGLLEEPLYPSILFANVGLSDSYLTRKKTSADDMEEIWKKYFDQSLGACNLSFNRVDDIISVSYAGSKDCWGAAYLFIYDVKKHIKKMYKRYRDGEVSPMMMTENNISNFTDMVHWVNPNGRNYYIDSVIYIRCPDNKLDLRGTLCEWLLNANANNSLPNKEGTMKAWIYSSTDYENNVYVHRGLTLSNWLNSCNMEGVVVKQTNPQWFRGLLEILFREKQITEQFAKCGLWNLFVMCLTQPDWIVNSTTVAAKDGSGCLTFNPKAKSLTNAFNLRMDQLRIVNNLSKFETDSNYRYNITRIDLNSAIRVLGMTPSELKALDLRTFERVVAFSRSSNERNDYWSSQASIASRLNSHWGSDTIRSLIKEMNGLSSKLNFIEKIFMGSDKLKTNRNIVDTAEDYFNMRRQLKELIEREADVLHRPDAIVDLARFDKTWPLIPGSSSVFIRYERDCLLERYRYGGENRAHSQMEFIDFYTNRYGDEETDRVKFVYSEEDHRLLGARIQLNAAEAIVYLHDEISIEFGIRQDNTNAELFAKECEKAKELEYTSIKYGLRIIAPVKPGELRHEGSVLHHCVGSYIDSVARGKEKILFIRRNDMPDDSYFTLDIMPDGTIRQVHCYCNGDPTEEGIRRAYERSNYPVYAETKDIIGFLLEWASKKSGVKASSIRSQFGRLCAL